MPYSNIVFIKLYLNLFDEDDRFLYQLNERQQLLYIKLLYLAGKMRNKIVKNPLTLIQKVHYRGFTQDPTQDLLCDISVIKSVFKKFKETKYFYKFTNFDELHNWVSPRSSQGVPKGVPWDKPDKEEEEDKEKEKEEDKEGASPKTYSEDINNFFTTLQEKEKDWTLALRQTYPHLDLPFELGKARMWLLANTHKPKKNFKRFLTNWLSRVDTPNFQKGGSNEEPPKRRVL